MKINESQLRNIIKEAINELDWKTYANAAKKAKEWREENPYKYDRNRGMSFDRAAVNAFNKQHDIENLPNFGGERGNINFRSDNGNVELSGSRDHDFGFDKGGMLNHNVSHLSKQYGKDGKYGRARMWDRAYETTPEEFYDNDEMATKFKNAEKEVEDFNSGKYVYNKEKGWHLNENQLRSIIRESIEEILAHNTVTSAYDKMRRYGSHSRANNFAKNYSEILNREYPIVNDSGHEARFLVDSNELYLKDDTNNYFHYSVKDDDWYVSKEGRMVPVEREPNAFPKFNNRQNVINLCKFMKQLKPDTGLANKQYYIH